MKTSSKPIKINKSEPRGFVFPRKVKITAVGQAEAQLDNLVPTLLASAGITVVANSMFARQSRQKRYMSVTVMLDCPTRAAYDKAHEVLRAQPAIKYTL